MKNNRGKLLFRIDIFRNFAPVKEKRRFAHGETACYYQRDGVLLKDRQGDDVRRHDRSPGRENQSSLLTLKIFYNYGNNSNQESQKDRNNW